MTPRDYPPPPSRYYDEVVETLPRLDGLTVAVTGSTSGTGEVYARTAGRLGARVIVLNRPSARADAATDRLRDGGADVVPVACDLQSFESVRDAGEQVRAVAAGGLDVLCNNAGVMGLPDQATSDGCDVQMQTNHLSHFLLTSLLWPALQQGADARGRARVVSHSSGARRGPALKAEYFERRGGHLGGDGFPGFGKWRRYQQSKLANLLFSYALLERMPAEDQARGIQVLTAHPGPTNSGLQAKTGRAGGTRMLDRAILIARSRSLILWRTGRSASSAPRSIRPRRPASSTVPSVAASPARRCLWSPSVIPPRRRSSGRRAWQPPVSPTTSGCAQTSLK